VWNATGTQVTPYDSTSTTTPAAGTSAVDVPAGGFCVAAASSAAATTWTWSGLTERYDSQIEAGGTTFTGASDSFVSATTPTISATPGTSTNPVLVAASW
jgi:hypothetical protein